MKRLLAALLLLPTVGFAQDVDLSTLPDDFSFISRASDGDTIVEYVGQDGDLYKFTFDSPETRKDGVTGIVWTNSASQTVKYEGIKGLTLFSPHDCAPGVGTCEYSVTLPDGEVYKFLRSAFMLGDVEIGREYLIDENGAEILYSQSCTTFDQYGFWIDGVRYDFEGVFEFDKRAESSESLPDRSSYERLRKLCDFTEEMAS